MAKVAPILPVGGGLLTRTALNARLQAIEAAFQNTLSLDGSIPNEMQVNLSLGDHRLINVRAGAEDSDAATMGQLRQLSVADTGSLALRADLAGSSTGRGTDAVGVRDLVAPAYLKTVSDIINGLPVSIDRFANSGVAGNGTNNDSVVLQRANDAIVADSRGIGGAVMLSPFKTYKMANGISWDANKVGLLGNGSLIDATGVPNGTTVIRMINSEGDTNVRPLHSRRHPWEKFGLLLPDAVAKPTVIGILIDDTSGNPRMNGGVTFQNGGIVGGGKQIVFGDGANFPTFSDWEFTNAVGRSVGTIITNPPAVNMGERMVFRNCRFGGAQLAFSQTSPNASVFLQNCSLNYCVKFVDMTAGKFIIEGSHIENNFDTDYWFVVSAGDAALTIDAGTQIVVGGAKNNKAIFLVDDTNKAGGLTLGTWGFYSSTAFNVDLIDGRGGISVGPSGSLTSGTNPILGPGANLLAYGDFESANYVAEWILAGGAARSTTTPISGTNSLLLPGVAGSSSSAATRPPCLQGQRGSYRLRYKTTGVTSKTLVVNTSYVDAGGNDIPGTVAADIVVANTNVPATLFRSNRSAKAPSGTRSFQIAPSFFGADGAAANAFIDDVVVNVN